jgi:hypothetical protein
MTITENGALLRMWNVIKRGILPALFVIGGLGSLIYGAFFHSVPVLEEQKSRTTVDVPIAFPSESSPFPGGQPFEGPPQFRKQTVEKTVTNIINESEPELNRDLSVGGVALIDSGKLKRTYSGKAPSLCPT